MNDERITLSRILTEEKLKNKSICIELADYLKTKGIDITPRQIQKYKNGEVVPQYHVIVEIFNYLKMNHDENTVLRIIKNSRKYAKEKSINNYKVSNPNELSKVNDQVIHTRLTLKSKDFTFLEGTNVDGSKAIEFILDKVKEQYGDDKYSLSRYIIHLIDEDNKI